MSNSVIINYASRTAAFIISGVVYSLHPALPYLLLLGAMFLGAYCTLSIKEAPFDRTQANADRQHIMQGAKVFFAQPSLLRCSALMLAGYVLVEQLWFSFQPLLTAAHMRPFDVGCSYALGALASVLGARIAKRFLAQHRDGFTFGLALALCACGGSLFAVADTAVFLVVAQVVTCLGFGVIAPVRSSVLHAHLPSAHRAVCVSIFTTIEALLTGLVGCALGYLYEHFSRALPPTVIAAASSVLIPVVYRALTRVSAMKRDERK